MSTKNTAGLIVALGDSSRRGGMALPSRSAKISQAAHAGLVVLSQGPADDSLTTQAIKQLSERLRILKDEMYAEPKNKPKGPQQLRRFPVSRRLQGWK